MSDNENNNDKSKVNFTPLPDKDIKNGGGFQRCEEVNVSCGGLQTMHILENGSTIVEYDPENYCICDVSGTGDPHISTFFGKKYDM